MNEWHGTKYTQQPQLCTSVLKGQPCTRNNCNRIHDLEEYKKVRPAPVDIDCPQLREYGTCQYKWNCIFRHPGDD